VTRRGGTPLSLFAVVCRQGRSIRSCWYDGSRRCQDDDDDNGAEGMVAGAADPSSPLFHSARALD
jgi:hypothetical protein